MVNNSNETQLNRNGNRRGMHHHPNSLKNLEKRNNKGNSHAKKDYSLARIVKEMVDDPAPERWLEVEDKGKGLTYRQGIAKRILIESLKGNAKIISELFERLDGKVTLPPIELTGAGGQPLIPTCIFQMPDGFKLNPSEIAKSK